MKKCIKYKLRMNWVFLDPAQIKHVKEVALYTESGISRVEKHRVYCELLEWVLAVDFTLIHSKSFRQTFTNKLDEILDEQCAPCFRPRIARLTQQVKQKYNL